MLYMQAKAQALIVYMFRAYIWDNLEDAKRENQQPTYVAGYLYYMYVYE